MTRTHKAPIKFARVTFLVAGSVGLLSIVGLYSMSGSNIYYGSLAGLLAWQFAFFVIASDPERFRPLMFPAIFEKSAWVLTLLFLFLMGRVTSVELAVWLPGSTLLGILFAVALLKTSRRAPERLRGPV
jgi:hypothetical protein